MKMAGVIILLLITGLGMWFVGVRRSNNSYNSGYEKGYQTAEHNAEEKNKVALDEWSTNSFNPLVRENNELRDEYNALVIDYNNLRNAAINYVNANNYQQRQPITCHTNTFFAEYGSITTTCN